MRAFVAVEISDDARRAIASVRRELEAAKVRGWKFTAERKLHVTMKFLGEIDESMTGLVSALSDAARTGAPFGAGLSELGWFPARGSPRILWVGVRSPAGELERLAGAIEASAAALGVPREERPFTPHITMARARRGERPGRPPPTPAFGELPKVGWEVERFVLMRSVLAPEGSRYELLEAFPLG